MTLADALRIALAAYDEDEAEREAILDALRNFVWVDRQLVIDNLTRAWREGWEDEIREALTAYQVERAEIDHQAALDEGS